MFAIAIAFWWSVRSGQFDDLEGPGFKVLMEDEECQEGRLSNKPKSKGEKG